MVNAIGTGPVIYYPQFTIRNFLFSMDSKMRDEPTGGCGRLPLTSLLHGAERSHGTYLFSNFLS